MEGKCGSGSGVWDSSVVVGLGVECGVGFGVECVGERGVNKLAFIKSL